MYFLKNVCMFFSLHRLPAQQRLSALRCYSVCSESWKFLWHYHSTPLVYSVRRNNALLERRFILLYSYISMAWMFIFVMFCELHYQRAHIFFGDVFCLERHALSAMILGRKWGYFHLCVFFLWMIARDTKASCMRPVKKRTKNTLSTRGAVFAKTEHERIAIHARHTSYQTPR